MHKLRNFFLWFFTIFCGISGGVIMDPEFNLIVIFPAATLVLIVVLWLATCFLWNTKWALMLVPIYLSVISAYKLTYQVFNDFPTIPGALMAWFVIITPIVLVFTDWKMVAVQKFLLAHNQCSPRCLRALNRRLDRYIAGMDDYLISPYHDWGINIWLRPKTKKTEREVLHAMVWREGQPKSVECYTLDESANPQEKFADAIYAFFTKLAQNNIGPAKWEKLSNQFGSYRPGVPTVILNQLITLCACLIHGDEDVFWQLLKTLDLQFAGWIPIGFSGDKVLIRVGD